MFKKTQALNCSRHRDLRFSLTASFAFTKNKASVALSFSELRAASQHYPIVFLKDGSGIPQALLSLEPEKNVFVDENGQWKVPYIPAFFKLYPFTMAKIETEPEKVVLCLDPEAEHFSAGMGEPLCSADGSPSQFLQDKVIGPLKQYHQELNVTRALFKPLMDKEVIVDRTIALSVNGEEKKVGGFMGVDMEKLNALEDRELAAIARSGVLGAVH